MKRTSRAPAMPSVTSASITHPAVPLSDNWWLSFRSPSTRANTSTRTMILLRGSARIAVCRFRRMRRPDRMGKRCGVMESGFSDLCSSRIGFSFLLPEQKKRNKENSPSALLGLLRHFSPLNKKNSLRSNSFCSSRRGFSFLCPNKETKQRNSPSAAPELKFSLFS